MRRLSRFMQLSGAERAILLQAALGMTCVRLLLGIFPLPSVQQHVRRSIWRSQSTRSPDRIVWAIRAAARFVPKSTCLIQSLAAQALLNHFGHEALLTIGVAKSDRGRFEAHAWVSCGDQVLIGGPEIERYDPLLNLGSLT
jgi:Transglutaminase-like superfamily